jgi:hypothetical protein
VRFESQGNRAFFTLGALPAHFEPGDQGGPQIVGEVLAERYRRRLPVLGVAGLE